MTNCCSNHIIFNGSGDKSGTHESMSSLFNTKVKLNNHTNKKPLSQYTQTMPQNTRTKF